MSAMQARLVVLAGAMTLLAAGCGSKGGSSQPIGAAAPATTGAETIAPSTASSSGSTSLLADGTYRTAELTLDQLMAAGSAAGFAQADIDAFVVGDGIKQSAVMTVRLAGGGWSLLQAYDGRPAQVGWRGSYEVVDDHTVVASTDCGKITYRYTLAGDQLSLKVVDDQCPGVGELVAQTIVYESAPFTRVATEPATGQGGAGSTYASKAFVSPFDVTLPSWLSNTPTVDEHNFVTWEATDADRAVRVLAPVNVYAPGGSGTAPPPEDYLAYLLSQTDHGAHFTDVTKTTVGGHSATILTATTANSLDGSLGCQQDGMAAADCFGLQPELTLRIAVVDAGDQTILIWLRNTLGVDETQQLKDFEHMLASIHFR